jgi:hypothetical protein
MLSPFWPDKSEICPYRRTALRTRNPNREGQISLIAVTNRSLEDPDLRLMIVRY